MVSPEFKDANKKLLAFENIDAIMDEYGCNRKEYQKKWGVLQGQFLCEVNHKVKSKKSEVGFVMFTNQPGVGRS